MPRRMGASALLLLTSRLNNAGNLRSQVSPYKSPRSRPASPGRALTGILAIALPATHWPLPGGRVRGPASPPPADIAAQPRGSPPCPGFACALATGSAILALNRCTGPGADIRLPLPTTSERRAQYRLLPV
jgi:hypothetical protein